jgi:phage-related protein
MHWKVVFLDSRVESGLLAMSPGFLGRLIRYAERMEIHGPDLGMPHTRTMGGGLFELRLKGAEGIARVFYCTWHARRIVVLHHFVKKSRRTPSKEMDIARQRLKEAKNAF